MKLSPCSFSIEIPSRMKIINPNDDKSPDWCDFDVILEDGFKVMELHSMLSSRFSLSTIEEFYNAGLQNSSYSVTYKFKGLDYFVISGLRQDSGNIFYWKRVLGEQFISDLFIEYSEKHRSDIEKYIGRISKSFKSD